MISGRQNMRTKVKKVFCDGRRHPESSRGVLSIYDDQINLLLMHNVVQVFLDDSSPGASKHVTDKENIHCTALPDWLPWGNKRV